MFPHEKELVERLKDEPFTLLGVNTDKDAEYYRAQVEENGITWRSTFEGSTRGPVPTRWGVTYYPTIYVLDHEGAIRFKDVRGEDLDAAVDQLLAEMKGEPPRPAPAAADPEPSGGSEKQDGAGAPREAAVPAMPLIPMEAMPRADEPGEPIPPDRGGIAGRAVFRGQAPPLAPLSITARQAEGCLEAGHAVDATDRSRLIDARGGVQNVLVKVRVEGAAPAVPAGEAGVSVLDQRRCRFEPHALIVPVGGTLRVLNSDEISHNVHTYSIRNQAWNRTTPGGADFEQVLERPETFQVKCDIHPWMSSWIHVVDTPFAALTGPDGTFRIDGLPPGEHEVEYWHEDRLLGKGALGPVSVKGGELTEVELELGGDAGPRRRRR